MTTYTDPYYKKMKLFTGPYSSVKSEHLKYIEYWIEKLSHCEMAYLFVYAASHMHSANEVLFKIWQTEQDPQPDHRTTAEHYIGIPSLELFFSFEMKIWTEEVEEDGDYYTEVSDIIVKEDSFSISTAEDSFDIKKEDFAREIPDVKWNNFLQMVDIVAENQYRDMEKDKKQTLEKIFQSTSLSKKIEEMDVDKKIINIGKAKSIGLL
jgi:hypothetical protein